MSRLSCYLWLAQAEDALKNGNRITVRPTGSSMQPLICEGDAVTLEPILGAVEAGDVVLARVGSRRAVLVLHQVLAAEDGKYLIGNASGREDGWVAARDVLGVAARVERAGGAE